MPPRARRGRRRLQRGAGSQDRCGEASARLAPAVGGDGAATTSVDFASASTAPSMPTSVIEISDRPVARPAA